MKQCVDMAIDRDMAIACPYDVLSGFFLCIDLAAYADQIAKEFKDLLGEVVICVDGSWMEQEYLTIMDMLSYDDLTLKENDGRKILIKAFMDNGFKYASECSYKLLHHLYDITETKTERRIKCNYRRMQLENLSFVKELDQCFRFQTPDRYQDLQILHRQFQNDERNNHERVANNAIFLLKIYISFFFSFD